MKIKFPLYAKILFWFFLNVLFLCVVFAVVARVQFRFGLDSLISGPAGDRFQKVTEIIAAEMRDRPASEWNADLKHLSDIYGVQFFVFRNGEQLAGAPMTLPAEVHDRINERRGPGPPPLREEMEPRPDIAPQPDAFPPSREAPHSPGRMEGRKFMVHTTAPNRYWVITHFMMPGNPPLTRPAPMTLLAESESLSGGGLFFDLTNWVAAGLAVVVISVLFWFPLVRGITRSISRMTLATEKIAEGHFDVRTRVRRHDELGSLSEAINRMAMRLSGFVVGQKRFLGDIAHELCSPISRIQVALGILEQRADEKQKVYLNDLREEVEQMSNLVNELLSFSKASLAASSIKLQPVSVRAVVEKAVARECALGGGPEIKTDVAEALRAMAEPELLLRALANILRNAIHYAASAGPITITATYDAHKIKLTIEDCGPGIPEAAIAQVFDPFYRVDPSRARETGGVGLGLSIVKTCVEACGGAVRCENREQGGLRVIVTLAAAEL